MVGIRFSSWNDKTFVQVQTGSFWEGNRPKGREYPTLKVSVSEFQPPISGGAPVLSIDRLKLQKLWDWISQQLVQDFVNESFLYHGISLSRVPVPDVGSTRVGFIYHDAHWKLSILYDCCTTGQGQEPILIHICPFCFVFFVISHVCNIFIVPPG